MRVETIPFERVAPYYPKAFLGFRPGEAPDPAAAAARGVDPSVREAVRSYHLSLGGSRESVERLLSGAPAVVTGQQPWPALGPMYNVYKAITAIRLAGKLDAVPVFWVHSDDHNAAAVSRVTLPDRANALREIGLDLPEEGTPLRDWRPRTAGFVEEMKLALPRTEFRDEVDRILHGGSERGVSEWFAKILLALFGKRGLVAVEPRLLYGERAAELLERVLERPSVVREATRPVRGEEDVLGDPGTGVFVLREGRRRRLREGERPEGEWSAGVALRPVLQDAVLPVAATVGGPHEVAYLLQIGGLYEALGVRRSAVVPRISATIVEGKIEASLERSGRSVQDVLLGLAGPGRSPDDAGRVEDLERLVGERLEGIGGPSLADLRRKTREKISKTLRGFSQKAAEAEARRADSAAAREGKISSHLRPGGKLQERVLNPFYYLSLYGVSFLDRLAETLDAERFAHQVVRL